MDKKQKQKQKLSEIDICDLFITPAIKDPGWDQMQQIRCEVTLYGKQKNPVSILDGIGKSQQLSQISTRVGRIDSLMKAGVLLSAIFTVIAAYERLLAICIL